MAHFAQLDENNIVTTVIVVSNDVLGGLSFPESEPIGVAFCKGLYGEDTVWKQTSYNSNFRKNYAGPGCAYDSDQDAFIAPKPFPSWILNSDTAKWDPPTPKPDSANPYIWDEITQSWSSWWL